MHLFRFSAFSATTFVTLLAASGALAGEPLPKGTVKGDAVSKGKTDVTQEGFQSAAAKDDAKDATELAINAGGMLASGNSTLIAGTAGFNHRLRREDNQFTLIAAGNYSRASADGRVPPTTTVENLQGRARYDRFFATDFTFFLGLQARRDRFAGLDLRAQVDPGVGYYFVNLKERVFWAELGYDFLYDVRRDDARAAKDAAGKPIPGAAPLDKTKAVHSARAFLGYRYKINDGVAISSGIELLQGLDELDTRRVNGDLVVTSKFTSTFSLATSFLLRYDNKPLPGKQEFDLVTAINLVYTLL